MGLKPIVNFSGGEASPKLRGRADTVPYNTAAETLENVLVTKYGSAFKTPGTHYTAQVKGSSTAKRLIPFIFSTGDSFAIEFGNLYARFFQSGASVVEAAKTITGVTKANPGVVTSASHGYSNGDYVDISGIVGMTQLNGKRFIVAGVTTNTFQLTDEDGNNVNTSSYTTYSSGGIAEKIYQITTIFETSDLPNLKYTQQGDIMYIASGDKPIQKLSRFALTNWTIAGITYDTVVYPPFNDINSTATTLTASATTGTGVTLTASASLFNSNHVGSYWKIKHSSTIGYVRVTGYTSTTVVTVTVVVTLGGTTATDDWYEGSWSDDQGHPTDVKFFRNRLYAVGTTKRPLTSWASVIEEYENFNTDADGDGNVSESDSFIFTVSSAQVDKALWAYPGLVMTIGTAAGPFTLDASSALSIDQARQQNENGATSVTPVRIGSNLYYVERSGEILGEYSLSSEYIDVYETKDMTYIADHILDSGVKEMALQRYPNTIIWCVLNDGTIATFSREIEQNTRAWTRQVFNGTNVSVENVCVVPNGSSDTVWIIVKRTINGVTRRYVEYFDDDDFTEQEDAFYVQSGVTYSGTATTTLTNLDHLEGQTVSILSNGAVLPSQVVTSGSITLDYSTTKAHVGLGYTATIKTMDIEMASEIGSAQARVKTIDKVFLRLLKSLGMSVGTEDSQDVVSFRDSSMAMDAPPSLFSGDKEIVVPSGYARNKYIVITSSQPLPMHVLGIYARMKVSP